MSTIIDEHAALPERITASAERIRDLSKQLANELEIRNDLIIEGVDHAGLTRKQAAAAAGVSIPQVIRILSRSSED